MNELPSPPDSPQHNKPTSHTPWVLLLPLALLGGALWMRGNAPQTSPNQNQAAAVATPTQQTTAQSQKITIFLPDANADLRPRVVTLDGDLKGEKAAFATIEKVMQSAPDSFPKGAKVLGVSTSGGTLQVNFNQAFVDESFWQGSTRTIVGTYSIVNTLTHEKNGFGADKVQLNVENKPLELIGELDVSEPLKFDKSAVSGN